MQEPLPAHLTKRTENIKIRATTLSTPLDILYMSHITGGASKRTSTMRLRMAQKRVVTPPPVPSASSSNRFAFLIAVLFAASFTTGTAQSEDCVSYNTSSSAGNLWEIMIAHPIYFTCADDGFIVAVESTSLSSVGPLDGLSWT